MDFGLIRGQIDFIEKRTQTGTPCLEDALSILNSVYHAALSKGSGPVAGMRVDDDIRLADNLLEQVYALLGVCEGLPEGTLDSDDTEELEETRHRLAEYSDKLQLRKSTGHELAETRRRLQETLEAYSNEEESIRILEAEISTLQRAISDHDESKISILTMDRDHLRSREQQLLAQYTPVREEVARLEAAISGLNSRIEEGLKSKLSLEAELQARKTELQQQTEEQKKGQEELTAVKEDLQSYTRRRADLNRDIRDTHEQLLAFGKTLAQKPGAQEALPGEGASTAQLLDGLKALSNAFSKYMFEKQQEISSLQEDISRIRAELPARLDEINRRSAECAEKERELDDAGTALRQAQNHRENLEKEIRELRGKEDEVRSQLLSLRSAKVSSTQALETAARGAAGVLTDILSGISQEIDSCLEDIRRITDVDIPENIQQLAGKRLERTKQQEALAESKARLEQLLEEYNGGSEELKRLSKEIEQKSRELSNGEGIHQKQMQYQQTLTELNNMVAKQRAEEESNAALKAEIERKQAEIAAYQKRAAELRALEDALKAAYTEDFKKKVASLNRSMTVLTGICEKLSIDSERLFGGSMYRISDELSNICSEYQKRLDELESGIRQYIQSIGKS